MTTRQEALTYADANDAAARERRRHARTTEAAWERAALRAAARRLDKIAAGWRSLAEEA